MTANSNAGLLRNLASLFGRRVRMVALLAGLMVQSWRKAKVHQHIHSYLMLYCVLIEHYFNRLNDQHVCPSDNKHLVWSFYVCHNWKGIISVISILSYAHLIVFGYYYYDTIILFMMTSNQTYEIISNENYNRQLRFFNFDLLI